MSIPVGADPIAVGEYATDRLQDFLNTDKNVCFANCIAVQVVLLGIPQDKATEKGAETLGEKLAEGAGVAAKACTKMINKAINVKDAAVCAQKCY